MANLARGTTADGDTWELDVSGDPENLHRTVQLTRADGRRRWGSGCGGPALYAGRRICVCTGHYDDGPTLFLATVAADVRAVVVMLSDGTREDLVVHGDAVELGARVAVLLHHRALDVHRVDLIGADGSVLPETC